MSGARNVLMMVCIVFVAGSCASVSPSSVPAAAPPDAPDPATQWATAGVATSPAVSAGHRAGQLGPTIERGAEPDTRQVERPSVEIRTGVTLDDVADAPPRREPRSITIDGLDITAPVRPAGINDRGEFDLPPGSEAGWYRFGPTPGQDGSAVIAAHVDWNGVPGAFFDLREAKPGQRIVVDFDDDSTAAFHIVEVRQYDKTVLPLDELFVRAGDPQLTLITCGGEFDPAARSYEDNVVVIAEPVGIG